MKIVCKLFTNCFYNKRQWWYNEFTLKKEPEVKKKNEYFC